MSGEKIDVEKPSDFEFSANLNVDGVGIQGFDLPDSWNMCRYIVYSCSNNENVIAFRSDKVKPALEFIKKNETRSCKFMLYDRVLNSFDVTAILKSVFANTKRNERNDY